MSSRICFNLDQSKILLSAYGLRMTDIMKCKSFQHFDNPDNEDYNADDNQVTYLNEIFK